MHVTAVTTVCGGILGHFITYVGTVKRARRDALMRHYISLHPERFPEPGILLNDHVTSFCLS